MLTINPSLFLINSSLEQAQQIEELKLLYGDEWQNIYKNILTKQRLETTITKEDTKIIYNSERDSYSTCNTSSSINTKY